MGDVTNMVVGGVFLDLSPWSHKLSSYNSAKDSLCNIQTRLRDPHIKTSKGGQIWANGRGGKGEVQKLRPWTQSGTHCGPQERGGIELQVHSLWPQQSCLGDQHIIPLNPAIYRGRYLRAKTKQKCDWQLWSYSPHC